MISKYPHNPKTKHFVEFKELEGVRYGLFAEEKIRDLVFEIAKEEWDPEDYDIVGEDLEKSDWKLEEVNVEDITFREDLMNDPEFLKSLNLRVKKHLDVYEQKVAIPPLILRGKDLLIFDGYARTQTFKKLGVKKTLAYVGRR